MKRVQILTSVLAFLLFAVASESGFTKNLDETIVAAPVKIFRQVRSREIEKIMNKNYGGVEPLPEDDANDSNGGIYYSPTQIRRAYGLDSIRPSNKKQTIAVIEALGSPGVQDALDTFCQIYRMPSTKLDLVYPQGQPIYFDQNWGIETSLDTEWIHVVYPHSKIVVVVAATPTLGDLLKAVTSAVEMGADVVSMSWSTPEFAEETSYDYIFDHPGVTFVASSGDSGTGVGWPTSSPFVTSVGGTTLKLAGRGGHRISEDAWSGSGGGVSSYETVPSYQKEHQNYGKRTVPDVSYSADPNFGYLVFDDDSGALVVGGTSAGAPQWAALFAIANSLRESSLSLANAALYSLVPTLRDLTSFFFDVVRGCNAKIMSESTCALPGYDLVTGLGTPIADKLIPALSK